MMEDIEITIQRVQDIWRASENKGSLVESLGFEDHEEFLMWINDITNENLADTRLHYLAKLISSDNPSGDIMSNLLAANTMAQADLAILFMMLGRERERLEGLEK